MGIVIDLILIAIIVISVFRGYKKGLIKVAANLFAGIASIIIVMLTFTPVANAIRNNTDIDEKIEKVIVENTIKKIQEQNNNVANIVNKISEETIEKQSKEMSIKITNIISIILVFIITKIILSIVFSLIEGIAELPILKQFNEVGGIMYGIIRGGLIILVCVFIIGLSGKINSNSKIEETIEKSCLTKIIYNNVINFN